MARKKSSNKSKDAPKPADDAKCQRRHRRSIRIVWVTVVLVMAVSAAWGMKHLEQRILAGENGQFPPEYRIVLVDRSEKMPSLLARRIALELRPREVSYFDSELTRRVHRLARQHPWVDEVQLVRKRRTDDPNLAVVEVKATYRKPAAIVKYQGRNYFVDDEGVVLRDGRTYQENGRLVQYYEVPRYRVSTPDGRHAYVANEYEIAPDLQRKKIHYIGITGVSSPPPEPGKPWQAEDLHAALRLVDLFERKSYGDEITWIDVTNFGWRATPHSKKEPQLKLWAQIDRRKPTEIRWGQFPHPGGDWVVSPERKIANLDEWVAARGGVLSGWRDWIDLRYDHLLTSAD